MPQHWIYSFIQTWSGAVVASYFYRASYKDDSNQKCPKWAVWGKCISPLSLLADDCSSLSCHLIILSSHWCLNSADPLLSLPPRSPPWRWQSSPPQSRFTTPIKILFVHVSMHSECLSHFLMRLSKTLAKGRFNPFVCLPQNSTGDFILLIRHKRHSWIVAYQVFICLLNFRQMSTTDTKPQLVNHQFCWFSSVFCWESDLRLPSPSCHWGCGGRWAL